MRAFSLSCFHHAALFIYIKALKPSNPNTRTKLQRTPSVGNNSDTSESHSADTIIAQTGLVGS